MDNRRPPRNNSTGPGKYYDRNRTGNTSRGATTPGGISGNVGNSANGDNRYGADRGRRPAASRTGDRNPRFGGPANSRGRFGSNPPEPRSKTVPPPAPAVKITSDLQVTDGRFVGAALQNSASPAASTMPRSVRDSMFRVIARRVRGARFLDLGAGCGMIGLEAISRGSMLSTFVERSARSASNIRKNITALGVKEGHAELIEMEAAPFLKRSAGRKRTWDVVFLCRADHAGTAELREIISRGRVIEPGGIAVIEHASDETLPENLGTLKHWRTLTKDDVSISFYNRK